MYQLRLFMLLLRPSLLSGLGSLVGAGLALVGPNLAYLQTQSFAYEIFFGQRGLTGTLQNAQGSTEAFAAAISEMPFSYTVAMFVISVLTGTLIFICLQVIHRVLVGVATPVAEIREAGSSKTIVEKEIGMRILVRLLAGIAWIIYWLATVKILWPFCLLLFKDGAYAPETPTGLGYMSLALALMTIGIYLHVVFLRLALLKPRIFGGRRALQNALY